MKSAKEAIILGMTHTYTIVRWVTGTIPTLLKVGRIYQNLIHVTDKYFSKCGERMGKGNGKQNGLLASGSRQIFIKSHK